MADPVEQEIVARVVQEQTGGRSLRAIARGLTEDGIPSRGGRSWHHDTARRIIRRTQEPPASGPRIGRKGQRRPPSPRFGKLEKP